MTGDSKGDATGEAHEKVGSTRGLRVAIAFVVIALVLETVMVFSLTPGTFMLFVMVGVPLCVAAIAIYLRHVARELVQRQVL